MSNEVSSNSNARLSEKLRKFKEIPMNRQILISIPHSFIATFFHFLMRGDTLVMSGRKTDVDLTLNHANSFV